MKVCEFLPKCGEWAQWRSTFPATGLVLHLCETHKRKIEAAQEAPDLVKSVFVGAIHDGVKSA